MTPNRYNALMDRKHGQTLHKKELRRGWHFCHEFDGDLSRSCPFGCMKYINKRKHREALKLYAKQERAYENRLADLADANSY